MLDIKEFRKLYEAVERLANGVSPLADAETDKVSLEDEHIKKILNGSLEIITAYGIIAETVTDSIDVSSKASNERLPVSISAEDAATLVPSTEMTTISKLCKLIGDNLLQENMYRLNASMVNNWLTEKGYLKMGDNGKNKVATFKGNNSGIITEKRVALSGEEYMVNLYNEKAQQLIFNSLPEICEYINQQAN